MNQILTIDSSNRILKITEEAEAREIPLFSREAFALISREWVRIGWSLRYYHTFQWFGRPILQLPEDMIRLQETVYALKPDVIIECGIFDGGSLLFHASLCEAMGHGRVIGIDIEVRPGAREAIERHALAPRIEIIEGDSASSAVVERVRATIQPGQVVMAILDSNHTRDHVARELEAYAPMVTPGSCIVATDGVMRDLADVPGGQPEWREDNPFEAAREFLARRPDFELRQPESIGDVTYWPGAWLWRKTP